MDADNGITVLAQWQPVEGALGDVLAIIAELRPKSLTEAGCLGYDVYRGILPGNAILLVERYRDMAAIEAHRQTAHYQELVVRRALPLLAERQVRLLQGVPPA